MTIHFADLRQEGWGVTADFTPKALTGFVMNACRAAGILPDRPLVSMVA